MTEIDCFLRSADNRERERERERERCHMIKIADHVTESGPTANEEISLSNHLMRYYSRITF